MDFRDAVLEYAKQMNIDYPILIGEQDGLDAVNAFGVEAVGFPFTVFTDSQGRIVALHLGELTAPLLTTLLTAVRRVNSGELTPAAARLENPGRPGSSAETSVKPAPLLLWYSLLIDDEGSSSTV